MMAKRDKYLKKFNRTHSLDMEYPYKKFRNKVVSEIKRVKMNIVLSILQSIKLIRKCFGQVSDLLLNSNQT